MLQEVLSDNAIEKGGKREKDAIIFIAEVPSHRPMQSEYLVIVMLKMILIY